MSKLPPPYAAPRPSPICGETSPQPAYSPEITAKLHTIATQMDAEEYEYLCRMIPMMRNSILLFGPVIQRMEQNLAEMERQKLIFELTARG